MEEGLPSRAIDSVTRLGRQPTKGNQYREQRGIETPLLTLLLSPDLPDTPTPRLKPEGKGAYRYRRHWREQRRRIWI